MEKKKGNGKVIVAWVFLIILVGLLLGLNYVKFFGQSNQNIEEKPVENSADQAIDRALTQIVDNFNQHEKVKSYADNNIIIKAVLNHHSIYISYVTDTTITYEFTYQNLGLEIVIANDEENVQKFKEIYEILIYAVQQRLGNDQDIAPYISNFLEDKVEYEGLTKSATEDTFTYQMDITQKLEESIQNDQMNESTEMESNVDTSTDISE